MGHLMHVESPFWSAHCMIVFGNLITEDSVDGNFFRAFRNDKVLCITLDQDQFYVHRMHRNTGKLPY